MMRPMNWFKRYLLPVSIIAALAIVIYAPNGTNKLFWDDDDWIVNNPMVHSFSGANLKGMFTQNALAGIGAQSNYYRPFLFLTFAANYATGGINPVGYHLVSDLLHLANGILVFYLLNAVLKRRDEKFSWVALLSSILFVIHPLQTEAVTYVAGRGDPLAAFFMLGALALWYKAERRLLSWNHWLRFLSYGSLALALLSRETAIVFPGLLFIFYLAFLSREHFVRGVITSLKKAAPYTGIVAVYGILRLTVLNFANTLNFYTAQNVYSEHLLVRLMTFMHALAVYLRLLVWPTGLHMERTVPIHQSLMDWQVWPMVIALIALAGWVIYLYRTSRSSHRDLTIYRLWLFGVGWFFIALAPMMGITPINAILYEHWLYLPMIGFWVLIIGSLQLLWERIKSYELKRSFLVVSLAVFAGFGAFFAAQAVSRNLLWGNAVAFYSDILKYEPTNVKINNNLANLYNQEGQPDLAMASYQRAIAANDVFPQPYYNLGTMLEARGDLAGAINLYQQALSRDQEFFFAYARLVTAYSTMGRYQDALNVIAAMKKIYPTDPAIYYNSAIIHLALKDKTSAIADLRNGLPYATEPQFQSRFLSLLNSLGK